MPLLSYLYGRCIVFCLYCRAFIFLAVIVRAVISSAFIVVPLLSCVYCRAFIVARSYAAHIVLPLLLGVYCRAFFVVPLFFVCLLSCLYYCTFIVERSFSGLECLA